MAQCEDLCVFLIRQAVVPTDAVARCLREWERRRLTGQQVPFYTVLDDLAVLPSRALCDLLAARGLLLLLCPRCGRTLIGASQAGACRTCDEPYQAVDPRENLAGTWSVISSVGAGLPRAEPPPAAPEVVGRYRLLRPLGQGASGTVYLAQDPQLEREVALKLLHSVERGTPRWARFVLEARLAAQLDHPHVVRVMLLDTEARPPYLVMEHVEGEPFEALLCRPYRREEALRILARTARGVAALHARGIVHRDLKPANVLLDRQGSPKVTDFGLAKEIDGTAALTLAGQSLGTPHYMAPEQIAGELERIGPATDVFALGVTLFRVLTGSLPFQAGSVVELLGLVLSRPFPSARARDGWVPAALDEVCAVATASEPESRYVDGAAFAEALDAAILASFEPARRSRPSSIRTVERARTSGRVKLETQTSTRRLRRAHPLGWGVALPLAGAALLGAVLLFGTLGRGPSAPPVARRPPPAQPAPPAPEPVVVQPEHRELERLLARVASTTDPFELLDLAGEFDALAARLPGSQAAREAATMRKRADARAAEQWGATLRKALSARGRGEHGPALELLRRLPEGAVRFEHFKRVPELRAELERLMREAEERRRQAEARARAQPAQRTPAPPVAPAEYEERFRQAVLPLWRRREHEAAAAVLAGWRTDARWRALSARIEAEAGRTRGLAALLARLPAVLARHVGRRWRWRGVPVTIEAVETPGLLVLARREQGAVIRERVPLRKLTGESLAHWITRTGAQPIELAWLWYAEGLADAAHSAWRQATAGGSVEPLLGERLARLAHEALLRDLARAAPDQARDRIEQYLERYRSTSFAGAKATELRALLPSQPRLKPEPRSRPIPAPRPKLEPPELHDAALRLLGPGLYDVTYRFGGKPGSPQDFTLKTRRAATGSAIGGLRLEQQDELGLRWKPWIHGDFQLEIGFRCAEAPGSIELLLRPGYRLRLEQAAGRWTVELVRLPATRIGRTGLLRRPLRAGEGKLALQRRAGAFALSFDGQTWTLGRDRAHDRVQLEWLVRGAGQLTLRGMRFQGGLSR